MNLFEAMLPVLTLVALLIGAATAGVLTGEILVAVILCAAAVAAIIARRHGSSWDDVQAATGAKLAAVLPALLILLSIGILIAAWMASGTIAFLVNAGIRIVRPDMLLVSAFLATAIMSICTGTSWGSAGTIGVALMGVATALGAPLAPVAGAIVSGAYFGDKLSPLSDSTNICAIAADVPLYAHIRHMLWTAVPSFVLALVIYTVAGIRSPLDGDLPPSAYVMLHDLDTVFSLGIITLLPPLVVVIAIMRRLPPTLAIILSSVVALGIAVFVQGFTAVDAVTAAVSGFTMQMVATAGVDTETLGPAFANLVERGGLYGMATTLIVILAAFLLAAAMEVSGAIDLLIARMLARARSTFALIASTMAAGSVMIGLTSHSGVTSLVIGNLFQPAYRERDVPAVNLSRSLEDSVTLTEPLMPWTVSAVFMATTLGVATAQYAPWAAFCYGGPLFSLAIAASRARRPLAR